jgi:2-dehydro-3-deoxyphosphogluconate aldolase/(4S)-4-hydroxy-2-oxoglutarate aldolase
MNETFSSIRAQRLLPIVVIDNSDQAGPLGDALATGGFRVAEITFRTAAAEESIRMLAKRGDILVGAGTVLTTDQADRAIDAGAKFIVAPGTNPRVIEHVLKRGLPMVPGIATPTEIERALSLGVEVLKFFPAETMGGIAALKAFAGPFPEVRFMPTGGITPEIIPHYLRVSSVVACGGSWLAPRDLLNAGRFDSIAALIEQAKKLLAPPPEIAT